MFKTQNLYMGKQKGLKFNEFANLNSTRNIERYFEKKKERPKLLVDQSSSNQNEKSVNSPKNNDLTGLTDAQGQPI